MTTKKDITLCSECTKKDEEINHLRKHVKLLSEALEELYDVVNLPAPKSKGK